LATPQAQNVDWLDVGSTVMTIVMVAPCEIRRGRSSLVERLAGLAMTDELVVVCGSDGQELDSEICSLVARLRRLLPLHTIVALDVASCGTMAKRNGAVLDELMEVGSLPIVVTPARYVLDVAAEIYGHLNADRVVRVLHTRAGGIRLWQVWRRPAAAYR
jgi:hypothetical protein